MLLFSLYANHFVQSLFYTFPLIRKFPSCLLVHDRKIRRFLNVWAVKRLQQKHRACLQWRTASETKHHGKRGAGVHNAYLQVYFVSAEPGNRLCLKARLPAGRPGWAGPAGGTAGCWPAASGSRGAPWGRAFRPPNASPAWCWRWPPPAAPSWPGSPRLWRSAARGWGWSPAGWRGRGPIIPRTVSRTEEVKAEVVASPLLRP